MCLAYIANFSAPDANAESCEETWIEKKSSGGEIIMAQNGMVFQIDNYDQFDTRMWMPIEKILICWKSMKTDANLVVIYDLINLDTGDRVWATRIK
jgi:hypothetical protein